MPAQNRYAAIIEAIFQARYRPGQRSVDFERGDIVASASQLKVESAQKLGRRHIQLPIPNGPPGRHFEHSSPRRNLDYSVGRKKPIPLRIGRQYAPDAESESGRYQDTRRHAWDHRQELHVQ